MCPSKFSTYEICRAERIKPGLRAFHSQLGRVVYTNTLGEAYSLALPAGLLFSKLVARVCASVKSKTKSSNPVCRAPSRIFGSGPFPKSLNVADANPNPTPTHQKYSFGSSLLFPFLMFLITVEGK